MQDENNLSTKILSNIIIYMKYARFLESENRRETWKEIVDRNKDMHINKFPALKDEIEKAYKFVYNKKILPSMRSCQFAGKAIEISPNRIFNCSYLPVNHPDAFSETMFLLLGGTGVGVSVQKHHVEKLPIIIGPEIPKGRQRKKRYLIADSIEGWADAVKVLIRSYIEGTREIEFDFRSIRPKGAKLVTSGGKAPGPAPLKDCLHNLKKVLDGVLEERGVKAKLKPIEAHDMICYVADSVLAGGIRRAALISLFSFGDEEMKTCKFGNWWELNPQRGRANNSVVALRYKIRKKDFLELWAKIKESDAGEPGIYFSNDKEVGANPCVEIALKAFQFCNLVDINSSNLESQEDFNSRAKAASFIATLQAAYTNFHYLRDEWQENTEKDSLIGVSMTGIASGPVLDLNMEEAAEHVVEENKRVAKIIGINPASRVTCVKPSGTSSLVLGTSSGVHAWHSPYYIRRVRVLKAEPIYGYLQKKHPEIIEDDFFKPERQAIIAIPIEAPENAIFRSEKALELLERSNKVSREWVHPGHIKGANRNNVSVTVSIKNDEWDDVAEWMWRRKNEYNGISVLPFYGGTYKQSPFEEISREEYEERIKSLKEVNLENIVENEDNSNLLGEAACDGDKCVITSI